MVYFFKKIFGTYGLFCPSSDRWTIITLSDSETFYIVIKIDAVIKIPNDVERSEEECMFIAQQENNDDNLLDKLVYSADQAYTLYKDYALHISFSIPKGNLDTTLVLAF